LAFAAPEARARDVRSALRLICVPVQFRTVADALAARGIDLAVTVADELPLPGRRTSRLENRAARP